MPEGAGMVDTAYAGTGCSRIGLRSVARIQAAAKLVFIPYGLSLRYVGLWVTGISPPPTGGQIFLNVCTAAKAWKAWMAPLARQRIRGSRKA